MKTVVVETRADVRVLADLSSYLTSLGLSTPTRSSLLSTSIELLHHALVSKGKITPIQSHYDAVGILASQGIMFGRRSRRNLTRALEKEDLELESTGRSTEIESAAQELMELMGS